MKGSLLSKLKRLKTYIVITCIILVMCACSSTQSNENNSFSINSSTDYSSDIELNGFTTKLPSYQWVGDDVGSFKQVTMKETLRLFEEEGSGVVYYGTVGCQWCERAIPELNQVAIETGFTIYYVDSSIYGDEEREVYPILTDDYLSSILEINEDTGVREMYVPLVIGVKDGKLVGSHNGLVEGFSIENSNSQMSNQQKSELQNIYKSIINKVIEK